MSLSKNAENFFLSCGISSAGVIDIKSIFEKNRKEPKKENVIAILNKIIVKANRVTPKDGIWIFGDNPRTNESAATPDEATKEPVEKPGVSTDENFEDALDDSTVTRGTQNVKSQESGGSDASQDKVCVHLRSGHCNFGRNGQKKDETGKTCAFYHPKKICQQYLRVGRCEKKDCKNLHSFLCRNWKNGKDCWARDCKLLHPQQPAEPKNNRARNGNTGPRMAQNFSQAPPNGPSGRIQQPFNNAAHSTQQNTHCVNTQQHAGLNRESQAGFLDMTTIMASVTKLVAEMLAKHQQSQNQQQPQQFQQQMQQNQLPPHPPQQYQHQQQQLPMGQPSRLVL